MALGGAERRLRGAGRRGEGRDNGDRRPWTEITGGLGEADYERVRIRGRQTRDGSCVAVQVSLRTNDVRIERPGEGLFSQLRCHETVKASDEVGGSYLHVLHRR